MYIQIRNKAITEPIINILKQVKAELNNGKLKSITSKGDNVAITCPIHADGFESHPSCQVYCGEEDTSTYGKAHCFACGYIADLPQLISDCFNEDDKTFGEEWLLERYGNSIIYKDVDISEKIELKSNAKKYLNDKILEKFNFYHPYMYERKLTEQVIDKFKIGYDKDTRCIVFPVWDEHDKLVMLTKRSVVGKYFFIDKEIDKPVYLYNFIKKENITTVYVCESQINALTLWSWGYPAIALIGTGSSHQFDILKKSGIRNYILCFDGDEAGDKGIARFKRNMPKSSLIAVKQIPRGKDVNDLSKQQFEELKEL